MPSSPRFKRLSLLLLALPLWLQPAQAEPPRSPRQLIDGLGMEIRQILESSSPTRTPEDAERAVADQISALIRSSEGHLSLTEPDARGRTPLMLAASSSYALVVQALLADPSVRLTVDVADASGKTAWMVASFAPAMTLVACQPGNLTIERYTLMPPYVLRMSHLLKTRASAVSATIEALEAAGAERRPDDAKRAWLAQCPNTSPELRQALVDGNLMPTLVNTAISRQAEFGKATRGAVKSIPVRPPKDMRFVNEADQMHAVKLVPLLQVQQSRCGRMPKPELTQNLVWQGEILLKAVVSTRAGVVEVADIDTMWVTGDHKTEAADYFRQMPLKALAGYRCDGDFIFEQEFQYRID
jgi:hypothetical protein